MGKGLIFFSPGSDAPNYTLSYDNFARLFRRYELSLWEHGIKVFPGENGLIPIATTPGKIRIALLPDGAKDQWQFGLVDLVTGTLEHHGKNFFEFLSRLVTGALATDLGNRLSKRCKFRSS